MRTHTGWLGALAFVNEHLPGGYELPTGVTEHRGHNSLEGYEEERRRFFGDAA